MQKLGLLTVIVFTCTVLAREPVPAGMPIGAVKIYGNRSIPESRVRAKIRSKTGQSFDPAAAAEDARRIAELDGVHKAYYSTTLVEDKVQLTFVLVEKNIIRSISFIGNRKYNDKQLIKETDLKKGNYLDPVDAVSSSENLAEFYREKGFAFVQVTLDEEPLSSGKIIYKIEEGPRVRIKSVKFSGNKAFRKRSLMPVIKTKTRKFLVLPAYYVEAKVAEDVSRLQKVYQKKGYLNADVKVERNFSPDKSRVGLSFIVEEGPAYYVAKIRIAGNENYSEDRLGALLKLEEGQIYNKQQAELDKKKLVEFYHERGFINVSLEQIPRFVAGNRVNVEFKVSEGERFRIGQVNIIGNEQTQDKVVRRVLDEYDFLPGQWYDADAARGDGKGSLEKDLRRIVLAESAMITRTGEKEGVRDAQVSIVEGQTGSVMLGAGVSSDSGVIGQFVFEQRNFDISDYPEDFGELITGRAFKGAGQNLRLAVEPGTEISRYSISFTEPYLKDKPISLDVVASSYERVREAYDEERIKGYVGFEKRYKNKWRRSLSLRAEQVDVVDLDDRAPEEIQDVEGTNTLFGVRLGAGKNVTDDRFNPSKGYDFDFGYEQVGGDHSFGIASGTYRRYYTLHEDLAERKTVLSLKLHAASIVGDAPPFEKFYAGGSTSIRGFEYRGVSARAGADEDPIGSDWIFLANAETAVPLVGENL
ncbi:MAG: outer membrane protein assembly factor BamA, partial [Deltaproteobacteria bacterium]|nr:outer membrane protein assembly factor BamA [Deltaproteobacteria bacterium]